MSDATRTTTNHQTCLNTHKHKHEWCNKNLQSKPSWKKVRPPSNQLN